MIEETVDQLGRIDIVVANAAVSVRKPFLELEEEEATRVFGVSFWGVFHVTQYGARQMVAQGEGGSIVVISSIHARLPVKNSLPYNTAKAAINHMSRTMANELTQHRIRVNVVEPGLTDTPGERRYTTEEELAARGKGLPLGRIGTIEDIGSGVAYLVSDEASYVTGAILIIDGGLLLSLV
jgi:glucose 1-dehydrogenase